MINWGKRDREQVTGHCPVCLDIILQRRCHSDVVYHELTEWRKFPNTQMIKHLFSSAMVRIVEAES